MKLEIKKYELDRLRESLLFTSKPQPASISDSDIDHLLDSATYIAYKISIGATLSEALQKLNPDELDCEKATKALFVVRESRQRKMLCGELSSLYSYISSNLPQADTRWGLATGRENDKMVLVIAATTY